MHYNVSKQVSSWRAKNSYIWCFISWKGRFSHDVPKTLIFDALKRGKAGFLMTRRKLKWPFDALLRFVAGFLLTSQKLIYFMHYYVEKQVFSWRAKKVQICCLITFKSRFSNDTPKRRKFVALLRRKAGFLMMRKKSFILCIITWKSMFSHDMPKKCKFVALLRFEAGFLMTRQKGATLLHYYVEEQVLSWRAKISYILCIITWKSRFSHDVPKTLIFDVLKRGKAGILMTRQKLKCTFDALLRFVAGFLLTRQKLLHFMHNYVEKQGFSWHAKKVQICCINKFRSRFSHDVPKRCKFVALLRRKAGFFMMRQNLLYFMHYYVEKQVFSWHAKNL